MLEIIPYGRLGNNILQLIKCIYVNIEYYKHKEINFDLIKNKNKELFKNFPQVFVFDFPTNDELIRDTFWDINVEENKKLVKNIITKYIQPYIDYNLKDSNGINFDNDLIIHIRSGDILSENFPLNNYIQPPYSFYTKIIEMYNFENIYILSENYNLNPVISKLLDNHTNINFLSNDLETDFKIMLNAQFFVNSNSTLSMAINSLSKNKKTIFVSSWSKGYHDFKCIFINSSDYYCLHNTTYAEKINNMLNF